MRVEMLAWFVCELKSSYGRGWILCRRLEWERSTVSSRVALLLRSAEVKLLFYRFVQHHVECFFLSLFIFYFIPWLYFRAGSVELGSGEGMHSKKMAGRCTDFCMKKKKKKQSGNFFSFLFLSMASLQGRLSGTWLWWWTCRENPGTEGPRKKKKSKKPQHPGFPRGPPPWY